MLIECLITGHDRIMNDICPRGVARLPGGIIMGGHRNSYGYSEYHGRGGGRARVVLLFIIALLAVILAAGVAFMAVMGQYLEYTEDGVKIHWPWVQETATLPPIASDPIEVVSDLVDVTVEPTASPEPTPTPPPEYAAIGAVTVTTAQLRGGTAAQAVASAGGTALVVEMKGADGKLAWQSQAPLAATLGTNAGDNLTAQAVQTLSQTTELYLVARVQCFRDPVLARNWIGPLMTKGGNVWYDRVGVCWTSPANQQAVDYLSTLCQELADVGFDEILLENAGYPNDGQVSVLATSDNRPADLSAPVSAFLERIVGELAEKDVRLGVYASETLLPGTEALSGLTAAVLANHAGRVWLDAKVSAEQYNALLSTAGWEDFAPRLVVKDGSASGGSWYR